MLAKVIQREQELSALFHHAHSLESNPSVDPSVKAGFAQFLCVRTYAYFETSLKDILMAYIAGAQGDPSVARFAMRQLDQRPSRNLKHQQMLELIGGFDTQWSSTISGKTSGQLGDSLNSVVNNRNNIAHNELTAVYLTLKDVNSYYQDLQKILRFVHNTCV